MRYRHGLLVFVALCIVYVLLSARTVVLAGFYQDEQIRHGTLMAIAALACWTALEIAASALRARAPRCSCGYSLRGLRCPECGRVIGEGDSRAGERGA